MKSLALILLLLPSVLFGQKIAEVVPAANKNQEGNGGADVPFTLNAGGSARYQQVYSSSEFTSFGAPDLLISGLRFRTDSQGGAVQRIIPDIRIDFSTTAKAPDSLSPVFAENVGLDNKTVLARGPLPANTLGYHGAGSFDFFVPLTSPFYYSPSQGNLLMDIRNFAGGNTTFFDEQGTVGDSVSRVESLSVNSSAGVNAISGDVATYGLVTMFEMTPVPEPGTLSLMALGFGLAGIGYWKRKLQPRKEDQ